MLLLLHLPRRDSCILFAVFLYRDPPTIAHSTILRCFQTSAECAEDMCTLATTIQLTCEARIRLAVTAVSSQSVKNPSLVFTLLRFLLP